ncbi:MAG: hypothetical protein MUD08_00345 [Cytophagales bacterium]|jgi:hypothetical protein|nr:hypothetical protein [Cytophagales bacterium]
MNIIEKMSQLVATCDAMTPTERHQAFQEMQEAVDRLTYEEKLALQPHTTGLMQQLVDKATEITSKYTESADGGEALEAA